MQLLHVFSDRHPKRAPVSSPFGHRNFQFSDLLKSRNLVTCGSGGLPALARQLLNLWRCNAVIIGVIGDRQKQQQLSPLRLRMLPNSCHHSYAHGLSPRN